VHQFTIIKHGLLLLKKTFTHIDTSLGQKSLMYYDPKLWSQIPEKLTCLSFCSFGKNCKTILLSCQYASSFFIGVFVSFPCMWVYIASSFSNTVHAS